MASSGPNNPQTMANNTSEGTVAWIKPDNAKEHDLLYTQAKVDEYEPGSNYLVATNFEFNLPTGTTIDGIVVEIEFYIPTGLFYDLAVRIVKGGNISNTDRSDPNEITSGYRTYGSNTDKWGEDWERTDINDTTFGLAYRVSGATSGSDEMYIDHIRITVYSSSSIKTIIGLAKATSVKTVDGLAIASVKTFDGLA